MDETIKIPLRVIENGVSWQKVAQEELNTKIDIKHGLMRATIVKPVNKDEPFYLITYIHHLIVDGWSGSEPSTSYEIAESIADSVMSCLNDVSLHGDLKFKG